MSYYTQIDWAATEEALAVHAQATTIYTEAVGATKQEYPQQPYWWQGKPWRPGE